MVIDSESLRPHSAALQFVLFLRGRSRSPNTVRAYCRAVAAYLNWCERTGHDWASTSLPDLARFKTFLESLPTPSGGPRSGRTVDLTLTGLCEFLRFAAASGMASPSVAATLSERRFLRYVPTAFNVGERGQFRTVRGRILKSRSAKLPPATLTGEQQEHLLRGCASARDRFAVQLMRHTGLRIGELLGMRSEHLHFLPDSMSLGCRVPGAHVHVPSSSSSTASLNEARSKTGSRVVPVTSVVTEAFRDYRAERFEVLGERDASDAVMVNLFGPHTGAPMGYSNLRQILRRRGDAAGFRATAHMFRHTVATDWLEAGVPPDVVQHLLGHASASSLAVYSHPSQAAMRRAVDQAHPVVDR